MILITTLAVSFYKDGEVSVYVNLRFLVVGVRCEDLCRFVVSVNINSCYLLCVVIVVFSCV